MEHGQSLPEKWRRRRCLLLSVAVSLLIVLIAVVLALALRKDSSAFEATFFERCEAFGGADCQNIWSVFQQAYVGRDDCNVPMEAYDPLIAAAPIKPKCDRMMFWSKTKDLAHDFTKRKGCFLTLEDTLLGRVLNGLDWCGKEGSSETFTDCCPDWNDCKNNPRRAFWSRASAAFADAACGDVTVMLNGSLATPYDNPSLFADIEVEHFNSTRMRSLNVVLVTNANPVTNCTNASLKLLQGKLEGIEYNCKEVLDTQIEECASDPDKPCGACW